MLWPAKRHPHLNGLVLVDAEVVHETKDLLAMFPHALLVELGLWGWYLLHHPAVLTNLA